MESLDYWWWRLNPVWRASAAFQLRVSEKVQRRGIDASTVEIVRQVLIDLRIAYLLLPPTISSAFLSSPVCSRRTPGTPWRAPILGADVRRPRVPRLPGTRDWNECPLAIARAGQRCAQACEAHWERRGRSGHIVGPPPIPFARTGSIGRVDQGNAQPPGGLEFPGNTSYIQNCYCQLAILHLDRFPAATT